MDNGYRQENYIRSKQIMELLLFEKDYISIGNIADRLFFSRSAVTADLPQLKRVIGRTAGAKLLVSGSRGLSIEGPENVKRIMCMKTLQSKAGYQILSEWYDVERFVENRRRIQAVLAEFFVQEKLIVSGEAYRDFAVYLAVCIMRTELGFEEEKADAEAVPGTLAKKLTEAIEKETGYIFSEAELCNIADRLKELNLVYAEQNVQSDILAKLNQFVECVYAETGLKLQLKQELLEILSGHIAKMELRIQSGRNNIGNHTKEMARRYPLEMHLLRTCLSPLLGLYIPDAEMGYLVLYLASEIDRLHWKPDVLFVSDSSASGIYNMQNKLKNFLGERIGNITVIPGYLYSKCYECYEHDFQLRITSEQEIILRDESFTYLDIFAANEQIMRLGRKVDFLEKEHQQKEESEFLRTYGADSRQKIVDGIWTLESLQKEVGFTYEAANISYETIGSSRLIVIDHTRDGQNRLWNIRLTTPLPYVGKQITELIAAHYGGDGDMIAFFDYVSSRLCEDRRIEHCATSSKKE